MAEVLLPTWIVPEQETQEWLDEGSSVFPSAFAPGLTQRQSYGGLRLKLSRRHTVRGDEKAQLLSILNSTRGRYNALRTKVHFALRGTFPATETLTNNTFASGTTGWTGVSGATLSVSDRILRVARGDSSMNYGVQRTGVSVTQYAPYVGRAMQVAGKGLTSLTTYLDSSSITTTEGTAPGLNSPSFVARGSTMEIRAYEGSTNGGVAGDYFLVPYMSLTRCMQIDNGLNALTFSDQFDNAAWSKTGCTVTANATTAPDGASTADELVEDSSNGNHRVFQSATFSSSVQDFNFSIALKANGRNFALVEIQEATGGTAARAWFNLSTGAVGTTSVGANWSSIRTHAVALGDSWYQCSVTARKTNAATSIVALIYAATADNVSSYTGSSPNGIRLWRGTLSVSSVPTRLIQTTASAVTSSAQTGTMLYVKGLPASTSDLLLPEDIVESGSELKHITAPLTSDAAGLGYLQFEPSLVRSPGFDAAVIVGEPMGKFLVSNIQVENMFGNQARVSYDLEHIYE